MSDHTLPKVKDPFAGSSEPEYQDGDYRIDEFTHVANGRDPWWFTKSELEQLAQVIADNNGPARQWIMTDASTAKYDDRVKISGGAHEALVRKKYMLAREQAAYDVLIDGQHCHAEDFAAVKLQISSLLEHTNYVDALVTRMSRQLNSDSLDLA